MNIRNKKQGKKMTEKTVFVGMSGGVDSSVSAALLKEDGYDVVGVFIKVWHPDFLPCRWQSERVDAMRVCARLDIPFKTLDLESEYKQHVVDYMIEEYKKGRTPNPDIMCNKNIKFGGFIDFARKCGADYVATGHYARVEKTKTIGYQLLQGKDKNKDQSYFLWTLTQNQLKHIIFPVGEYQKNGVRNIAKKLNLQTAEKKDSQGICFLGEVDMREFLKHFIDTKQGQVINTKDEIVGSHDGALLYTIGQRHGFHIDEKTIDRHPYYVVKKNIEENTITVSHNPKDLSFAKDEVTLESVNWILGDTPSVGKEYQARIRHRGELYKCIFKEGNRVRFASPQNGLAKGQSLVLYDGEICLGGGIISN